MLVQAGGRTQNKKNLKDQVCKGQERKGKIDRTNDLENPENN